MAQTLERCNELAVAGEDVDLHKASQWLAPQGAGPWAVFDLRLGKAMHAGFTLAVCGSPSTARRSDPTDR